MAVGLLHLLQVLALARSCSRQYYCKSHHEGQLPSARMCLVAFSICPISQPNHTFLRTHETQCIACQFFVNTSMGSASTLLMLRTIVFWNRAPLATASLIVASLGQWGFLLHDISTVRSSWNDVVRACAVDAVHPKFIKLNYLYSELSARSSSFFRVRQFDLLTINIDYSNVVRLDRPGAYNDRTNEVS